MADVFRIPMPAGVPRVESGPIQFGDDWPSLHLRGDDAFYLMMQVKTLAALRGEIATACPEAAFAIRVLEGYARMVDEGVIVRPANAEDKPHG